MKAVIIAGGHGKRLLPLTKEVPKPLVQVEGKEMLARILDTLLEHNITNVVFLVSYLGEKVEEFMKKNYPSLSVTYLYDPVDEETNYIYALTLAKEKLLDDDILLIHSDMLFQPDLLGRLLAQQGSAALVHETQPSVKDFNARIADGLIRQIDTKLEGENLRFLAPLYKVKKDDFVQWMESMENFVQAGRKKAYAEHAFNEMSPQFLLHPVYFKEHEICMEIDDFEDLEKAKNLLQRT